MDTDPICGMQLYENQAAQMIEYEGVTYYFCSLSCKSAFEREPEKFVQKHNAGASHNQ